MHQVRDVYEFDNESRPDLQLFHYICEVKLLVLIV